MSSSEVIRIFLNILLFGSLFAAATFIGMMIVFFWVWS